jgi:fructose-1,6-bisphosphatase/sedoheptulose 1,7-bisphosphatase-like protein
MNLLQYGFNFLKVTQAAAIAASQWIGRMDKLSADQAATTAMRDEFNKIPFDGEIIISEYAKDNAPGLLVREKVGTTLSAHPYHVATDPLDGTTQTAKGGSGAMSVVAVGDAFYATEQFYMKKLASKVKLNIKWDLGKIVHEAAILLNKSVKEVTVCLLDRQRHDEYIKQLTQIGCRVKLIADCDITAVIATALPNNTVDIYYGVGGAPEGVLSAAAMKCLGGFFEGEINGEVLSMDKLAYKETLFCATGVTCGSLLKGVEPKENGVMVSHSVLMHFPSNNVHFVTTWS